MKNRDFILVPLGDPRGASAKDFVGDEKRSGVNDIHVSARLRATIAVQPCGQNCLSRAPDLMFARLAR